MSIILHYDNKTKGGDIIGILDRFRSSENSNPSKDVDTTDLLKRIAEIKPEDIDTLIHIMKNSPEKSSEDSMLNTYLSLVKQVFGTNDYLSVGDRVETRQQRYEVYDEMDASTAYISSALDILSDDATQPDEKGVVMRIVSDNSKVKSIIEDLFIELEIEEKLSKWARAIAKYGDFFVEIDADEKQGVKSVLDTVYPGTIERKELNGKLLAFVDVFGKGTVQDNIYAPWKFIHFRHKGDIYRSQDSTRISMLDKGAKSYSLSSAYGQSILRPAIKVYAQLRFVENLIILSRLTNSIRRNIFLINTGDVSPDKAFETIKNYADLLKKDISLDIESGIYKAQKHTVSYDEDIFIPVSDTKNDVRIESVGGDVNIGEQYDLEYLLNKLFASLKIPKAYLNYEQDLNARSTLIQLDIRYARSVGQLQTTLVGGLLRLANIHLAYLGIDPDAVDLDIQLTNVSSIDKETRLEQKKISIEAARTMWDMLITMNDKLLETKQGQQGGMGMPGMSGNPFESEDPQEQKQEPNEVLDLKYVTEHILSTYFELDPEDIDKILKKKSKEEVKENQSRLFEKRRRYPNADLHEMYPTDSNIEGYQERINEALNLTQKSE